MHRGYLLSLLVLLPSELNICYALQVDFGVDLDSRVALVGPNGAGAFNGKLDVASVARPALLLTKSCISKSDGSALCVLLLVKATSANR